MKGLKRDGIIIQSMDFIKIRRIEFLTLVSIIYIILSFMIASFLFQIAGIDISTIVGGFILASLVISILGILIVISLWFHELMRKREIV